MDDDYPKAWAQWVEAIICPTVEQLLQAGYDLETANQIIIRWHIEHPEEPEG